mgnify:CR=1 FL=1
MKIARIIARNISIRSPMEATYIDVEKIIGCSGNRLDMIGGVNYCLDVEAPETKELWKLLNLDGKPKDKEK